MIYQGGMCKILFAKLVVSICKTYLCHLVHFCGVAAHIALCNLASQFFVENIILNGICRTLMGIMDDYFDGYYSEEMIESQVAFN